jgi:hypothetical protein
MKRILFATTLLFFFGVIMMISPVGRIIERGINLHLMSINNRLHTNSLTTMDKLQCRFIYGSIILGGKFIFPEGSEMLDQYINGNGEDHYIDADYIKTSPVVEKHLANMRVGETRVVVFKQHEDWRLSYALNPFRIKKEKDKVKIWQEIVFLKRKDIYTDLNFGIFKIRLQDGLIHALNPKKYTIRAEWNT